MWGKGEKTMSTGKIISTPIVITCLISISVLLTGGFLYWNMTTQAIIQRNMSFNSIAAEGRDNVTTAAKQEPSLNSARPQNRAEGIQAPAGGNRNQPRGTQAPSERIRDQSEGTQAPGEGTQDQTEGTQTSGEGTQNQFEGTQVPADGNRSQSEGTQTSGAGTQDQSEETQAPTEIAQSQTTQSQSAIHNVEQQIQGKTRVVILMHDLAGKNTTIQALPVIIETLKKQGFTFEVLGSHVRPIVFPEGLHN